MEWFWACSVVVSGLALLLCSLCILGPFWIWLKVMLEDWHKPAAYTLCAGGGMPRSSDESPEEVEGLLLTCNLSGNEEEDHVLPAPWVIVEEDKDPEHQEQASRLIKTWGVCFGTCVLCACFRDHVTRWEDTSPKTM